MGAAASGVFEGVDQTRALLLTGEYLLDLFHLHSDLSHTYDYLFHGLCRHLADPNDVVRLDGSPLFTFSDGEPPCCSRARGWPSASAASAATAGPSASASAARWTHGGGNGDAKLGSGGATLRDDADRCHVLGLVAPLALHQGEIETRRS